MGQTLTHGVYLPSEGERNCYNGLASNWRLLDGAIGTVAAHTTAIAGKADISHTHGNISNDGKVGTTANLPLITGTGGAVQAGAFGNQANTFCEGNDSRLSDARTPVAHTHGKADITDLFNSANTWSGNNSYTGIVSLDSSSDVAEQFKQKLPKDVSVTTDPLARFNTLTDSADHNIIIETLGHWASYVSKSITLQYKNDSTKQGTIDFRLDSNGYGVFYPQTPFECNLGNAYNQWNNLYAKNYYYNGVAWGLDKANTWTASQRMSCNPTIWDMKNTTYTLGTAPSGNKYLGFIFYDSADTDMGRLCVQCHRNGNNYYILGLKNSDGTTAYDGALRYSASQTNERAFYPEGGTDLGTATAKWKTLNGVNPGALSLPDYNNYLDVTSSIPVASLDGTQIDLNTYVADKTGWLSIVIADTAGNYITVTQGRAGGSTVFNNSRTFHTGAQSNGYISVFFPIIASMSKFAFIKASSLIQMRFYYCLGNV